LAGRCGGGAGGGVPLGGLDCLEDPALLLRGLSPPPIPGEEEGEEETETRKSRLRGLVVTNRSVTMESRVRSSEMKSPDFITIPLVKGVHRCRFRCLQMSMSNVDRVPCKCRCKYRKYINLSREKRPTKPESYVEKMQNRMLIYICIYIYIYTHTHTHTKRLIFQAFSRGKEPKIRD